MNKIVFVLLLSAVFASLITKQKLLSTQINEPDNKCFLIWYENTGRIEAEFNPDCVNCAPCRTSYVLADRWLKCMNSNYNFRICGGFWNVPIKAATDELIAGLDDIWAKAKTGEGCEGAPVTNANGFSHIAEVPST